MTKNDGPISTPPDHDPPCLITGGAGFIGSHLTDHLLGSGRRVVVVDDFSTGRVENLPKDHPNLKLIRSSLDQAIVGELSGCHFSEIYHLAAVVGVQRVVDRPIEAIEQNVADAAAIFRYALDHGPSAGEPPKVLFASSSEVYGKSTHAPFSETDDCLYGPTTARRWSYAASKALGEHLALAHHAGSGLPVVTVRLFNTVGPRQVGEYGMVLPRFVESALGRVPLMVHGDGEQSRCFCDVRDVAPVLAQLLRTPECSGRVFNVGSDRPITIRGLAELVNETLGSDAGIRTISYHEVFGPDFEDLPQRRPELRRLRSAIAFEPSIELRQTILDLADHIRSASPNHMPTSTA